MIKFTKGDTARLQLTALDGLGMPVDLTGATFTSYLVVSNGVLGTYGNSQHTADPDQVANKGKFTLLLSSSDTAPIDVGSGKELVTTITIGASVVSYHGPNVVTVLPVVPNS